MKAVNVLSAAEFSAHSKQHHEGLLALLFFFFKQIYENKVCVVNLCVFMCTCVCVVCVCKYVCSCVYVCYVCLFDCRVGGRLFF